MDAVQIEKAVKALGDKPTLKNFIEQFGVFAQGPGGTKNIKNAILNLAASGNIVSHSNDSALDLFEKVKLEKEVLIKEGVIKKQKSLPSVKDGDFPYKIPNNWIWVCLGDISNYAQAGKVEAKDAKNETWVLELEDIEKDTSRLLRKTRFKERQFKSAKSVFHEGDIIYGKLRPYLDKVIIADENGVCTTEMIPFKCFGGIFNEYIRLVMKSPYFITYANESTHGMSLPRLGTDNARAALIPLPPLEEQKRIVAKVDELMALCDQLQAQQQQQANTLLKANTAAIHALLSTDKQPQKTNNPPPKNKKQKKLDPAWQRIANNFHTLYGNTLPMPPGQGRQKKHFVGLDNVKQLRQMILQLAVMGKLSDYFEYEFDTAYLLTKIDHIKKENKTRIVAKNREPEKLFEAPPHWEWVQFEDLLINSSSGWSPKCSGHPRKEENWGVLKVSAVTWGIFKPEENKELPDGLLPRPEFEVKPGDFLLSRANTAELVAKSIVVVECESKLIMSDKIVRLDFYRDVNKKYLSIWNNSIFVRQYYISHASGTSDSMRNITRQTIHEVPIPLPPLEEQKRIVAKVDQLMAICDQLEQQLTTAYGDAEKLINSTIRQLVA